MNSLQPPLSPPSPLSAPVPRPFERVTLSRQFQLISALLLIVGMALIGGWIARQIENNAVNRAASISAVYVESILAAQLRGWPGNAPLHDELLEMLDQIFVSGPLRRKVMRFKLWDADGHIRYSNDASQIGRRFPVEGALQAAFAGEVHADLSELAASDNQPERAQWQRLLEVYVPVHDGSNDKVVAVAEFYHSTEKLGREIEAAQQRSRWLLAAATIVIYLLLLGLVRRANDTILNQQHALHDKLAQLRAALDENKLMRARLGDAGARTTALNEEFLHRVAADLHDGPAQDIAFALLRFDEIAANCDSFHHGEAQSIREALRSALDEMRDIAGGIALPGIAELSLAETARRAVADGERLSAKTVAADIDPTLGAAPLAVKITLYRLIQESLANSWRHAPGGAPRLRVHGETNMAIVEIEDFGAGFDLQAAATAGRLGLAFMRERVRLLGGTFEIDTAPGQGTRIRARIPLVLEKDDDD